MRRRGGAAPTGLELTRQYYLRVIAARDGSPAAKAGLRPGDYIRAIDGQSTRDITVFEGMRLLRGKAGTKVKLTVLRGNAAEPHEVELQREQQPALPVKGRALQAGTGYLRIGEFTKATAIPGAERSADADSRRRLAADHRPARHGQRRRRSRVRVGAPVRALGRARLPAGARARTSRRSRPPPATAR